MQGWGACKGGGHASSTCTLVRIALRHAYNVAPGFTKAVGSRPCWLVKPQTMVTLPLLLRNGQKLVIWDVVRIPAPKVLGGKYVLNPE